MSNEKNIAITIDGPAGAGKSTVAKKVADRLHFTYIDTGAMYRAVAWKALQEKGACDDEAAIAQIAQKLDITLEQSPNGLRVLADGQDISEEIRTPAVSHVVSAVAKIGAVRERLVSLQRLLAQKACVVMDGRDIATHVLPNAAVKIFLTASVDERARRRYAELKQKGFSGSMEELKAQIAARDKADSEREISPLVKASEAILLDTTHLNIEEAVEAVINEAKAHI